MNLIVLTHCLEIVTRNQSYRTVTVSMYFVMVSFFLWLTLLSYSVTSLKIYKTMKINIQIFKVLQVIKSLEYLVKIF